MELWQVAALALAFILVVAMAIFLRGPRRRDRL